MTSIGAAALRAKWRQLHHSRLCEMVLHRVLHNVILATSRLRWLRTIRALISKELVTSGTSMENTPGNEARPLRLQL